MYTGLKYYLSHPVLHIHYNNEAVVCLPTGNTIFTNSERATADQ